MSMPGNTMTHTPSGPPGEPVSILLVEDNSDDALLMEMELRRQGLSFDIERVETEADFRRALAADPDLVLCDYRLPAFDGARALAIRLKVAPRTPFIFVSGTIGEDVAVESLRGGATDYVLKDHLARLGPVVSRALQEAVERNERERLAEEVAGVHRKLAETIDEMPAGFFTLDRSFRIRFINTEMARMVGQALEELIGRDIFEVFPELDEDQFGPAYRKVMTGREPIELEAFCRPMGGWFQAHAFPSDNGISVYVRDVSDRKRAEEAARRRESVLAAVAFAAERLQAGELWDDTLGEILTRLATATESNRAVISELHQGEDGLPVPEVLGEWSAPGLGTLAGSAASPSEASRVWVRNLVDGNVLCVAAELPPLERAAFERSGISTLVIVPVVAGDRWRGCLALSRPGDAPDWSTAEIDAVHIAANALGAAIDRRLREAALRDSEARYRRLAENAPDLIYRLSFTDTVRIDYLSPAVLALTGYTPEEGYRDPELILRVIHPDDRARFQELIANGSEAPATLRWRRRDGSDVWTETRSVTIRDDDGRVIALEGIARDVTDRVRAEEALRETNASLRAFFEASPVAILALDTEGRVTMWTPAAERMFGWSAAETIGKSLPFVTEDTDAEYRQLVAQLRSGHGFSEREFVRRRRDGSPIELSVNAAPVRDADGAVTGIVAIHVDITHRKAAELELRHALTTLRETDRQRRHLVANLVRAQEDERRRLAADIHDDSIQAMTASVIRLGLLRREVTTPEAQQHLADLEQTVRAAVDRLRNLLFELRPPALDREGLASAVRQYLAQRFDADGPDITLDDHLAHEPPPECRIILYRVLQEALTNVRKHARATSITIDLTTDGAGVRVRVDDDGIGFDPEDHPLLPGHLGLQAMRERAQMGGGWFRLESVPGKGTTTEFWVPDAAGSGENP